MGELQEKIIASREVFKGRLLKVKVEEVLLGDGAHGRREVVYHPGAVAIVPLTETGKVVMVRQFRLPARKALLEIPAGTLDENEPPEKCALRELAEEIGMQPESLEPLCSMYLAPGYSSELIHIFLGRNLKAASAANHDERLERVEIPLSEALKMIETGEIQDAKTIVGLLLTSQRGR